MKESHPFTRYLFVVNPIAGDRSKEEILVDIELFAEKRGLEIMVMKTSGINDDETLRQSIQSFHPEVIVATGGDGTVNLVAKAIIGTPMVMGIIPLGSGNGLSKDLSIPQDNLEMALNLLCISRIVEIDTLEVNNRFFIHLCDIGFNAHIVKLFNQSGKRGIFSYIKFSIREFFSYKTFKFKLYADGRFIKGNAFMITIANSNQFGSNITINPEGKMDDGKFEVIIIRRFPRSKVIGLFYHMFSNRIKFSPYCQIISCTSAKIITKKRKTLQYDGEIAGEVKEVKVKINHKSLKVFVPKI